MAPSSDKTHASKVHDGLIPGGNDGTPWQIIYAGFMGLTICAFGLFGGIYLVNTGVGLTLRIGGIIAIVLALGVGASCTALLTGARWSLLVCRIFALAAMAGLIAGISGGIVSWAGLNGRINAVDLEESRLDRDIRIATPTGPANDPAKRQELLALYDANRIERRQLDADMRNTRLLVFFLGMAGALCGVTTGLLFRPASGRYCTR